MPDDPTDRSDRPGLTIAVPTLNRGNYLVDTVNDLLTQDYDPIEILIVDQSDEVDPAIKNLVREHPQMISHHMVDFRGLPKARNYAAKHAKFEQVLFVDDDIRCGPELASAHVSALSLATAVAGRIVEAHRPDPVDGPTGSFNRWTATPTRSFSRSGTFPVVHGPGGNFSSSRGAITRAGGFDEQLGLGAALYEETDFFLRLQKAGGSVVFHGPAAITHLAAETGGCRVEEIPDYIHSLSRNRMVIIRRHCKRHHYPTAIARLLALVLAYGVVYREPRVFRSAIAGLLVGCRIDYPVWGGAAGVSG